MLRQLTRLLLNCASRKWVATCAGSRLKRILLLEFCKDSISCFSSLAWSCHKKSKRVIHSTWNMVIKDKPMHRLQDQLGLGPLHRLLNLNFPTLNPYLLEIETKIKLSPLPSILFSVKIFHCFDLCQFFLISLAMWKTLNH